MRKIKIDNVLKLKVDTFCDNLFIAERYSNFEPPLNRLEKLKSAIQPVKHKKYVQYIDKIIKEYSDILKADPDKMKLLITQFETILPIAWLNENIPNKKIRFHKQICEAMRYDGLRDLEYLNFIQKEGIKTCVYCTSQLALVVDFTYFDIKKKKKIKKRRARFELDHYYPKSEYPYLCTSFYNLYPVCGNCNRSKSTKHSIFELYTKTDELDVFRFWLDDESILKYLKTKNNNDIIIWFDQLQGDIEFQNNFKELFQIQGIYDTQKDLAEELILKAQAYSDTYKESLVTIFNDLFSDDTLINRLLIGNYDKPEDIFKRPMAKFQQDIAKQLKLI